MDATGGARLARPAVVFGGLIAALGALWIATPGAKDAHERRALEHAAEQAGLRVEDYFRHRLSLIDALAFEASAGALATPEQLQARATVAQASYTGFRAINWVDAAGIIQTVAPYAPNRAAVGRDVHVTAAAATALEEARRTGRLVVSAPLTLFQGGTGFVAYAPVVRTSSAVVGFVNGVFRAEDAILDCLRTRFLTDYDVSIIDGGVPLYGAPLTGALATTVDVSIGARQWHLSLSPRGPITASRREAALSLFAALLIAALAWALRRAATHREAFDKSEARGRAIVDALPDTVVEARDDGTVTAIHGAGRRRLISPEIASRLGSEIASALRTSASHSFEVPVPEGSATRWLEVRVSSLSYGDGLALVRDVTDRHEAEDEHRRLETQLRHAQKLEAVGQLAGGVAHDFNNLMTAVIAHAELARTQAGDREVAEDLEQIAIAARRATQLTQRLLLFSRREKGEPRPILLGELVRSLQPMLRRVVREDIALDVVEDAQPAWVMADPSQLEQVVLNLVMNASDAMPVAGRVDIGVRCVRGDPARGEPDGPCAELTVRDTGVGMTMTTRERLFEPYFTTKPDGRGSGLGLAIVYGVVTRARGRIHVDSVVGQGSTFRVILPAIAAPPPGSAGEAAVVEPGWGNILLAEDDELVRRAAVRALERAGYTVLAVGDGEQAIAALNAHAGEIRAVITDLVMPVKGGRELVEWMTRARLGVPIVLISGYAEDAVDLQAKVAAVVNKPYAPVDLTRALRRVLRPTGGPDPR